MAVNLSALAGAGQQFFTDTGSVLTGGKLYTYLAGTTTPVAAYTSASGGTAHTNPIVLDSAGRVPGGEIWLTAATNYKFVLKTSTDVLVATWDNITGINGTGITSNASSVTYDPYGTGAVATTVQTKLRQTISVFDFMTSAQIADVQSGTGSIDCLAAFNAAIASFPNNAAFGPYSGGNTIVVPQGTYYLSGQLNISRQIILHGVTTPDGNAWSGSILKFATGTTGIRIYDYRTSPAGTDASGTTIENLVIRTTRTSPATQGGYHGVHSDTRFTIRNCVVTYFGDCGINIVASSPAGNANNWRIDNVRCAENGFDGLFVDGADVNAGVAIRLDCSANLRYGIFDSSFLGNTYVGCHTASNVNACYKTDNANARNVFVGCYSESGQPAAELVAPTLVLGGLMAADFSAGTTAQLLGDNGLKAADGAVTSPSISLASAKTTGWYNISTDQMGWASLGNARGRFGNGYIKMSTSGSYWNSADTASEFVNSSATVASSMDYLTSTSYTGLGKRIACATASGTGFNLLTASNAGAVAFQILGNGNAQNANNSYGSTSDIKLKENVVDTTPKLSDLMKVRVVNYNFKTDPTHKQIGVIAQEIETVFPGIVDTVQDRDEEDNLLETTTKSVKYSVLVPMLVKAMQEQQDLITALTTRVAALEAK
jgi:hypothetical protein